MTRSAALNAIYELAKVDERVVFIGSDLAPNTLADFKRDFPDRYYMCGIQEQNIIGMAAGLALEGFIPYVNNIATFLTRRCYEQIVCDIALHNLPVRLLGNGGGAVYCPLGPTHTAIDDLAIMRCIPNMSVICCSDNEEMRSFMPTTLEHKGPMYIRLGKDSDPIINGILKWEDRVLAPSILNYAADKKICIISTGIMSEKASKIADDIGAFVIHMPCIKPLHRDSIWFYSAQSKLIVTMEEGILIGGLGSAVLECLADNNIQIPVLRFGLPDAFPPHYGEQADLLETYNLTPEKMAARIKARYESL